MNTIFLIKWEGRITKIEKAFDDLSDLITNDDTINYHFEKYRPKQLKENGEVETAEDPTMTVIFEITNDISRKAISFAHFTYRQQLIVLNAALIEQILQEFFVKLFTAYPSRMYDFINPDAEKRLKGKIDLREILNAETKEILISGLANTSSGVVLRGKFKTTLSNLEVLANQKFSIELKEELIDLVELRNSILHEGFIREVSMKVIERSFDTLRDLYKFLNNRIIELKLPDDKKFDLNDYVYPEAKKDN